MEISVGQILKVCALLPGGGFLLCLLLSIYTDWSRSVDTFCHRNGVGHHPVNYLPSISMMISDRQPMMFIWRAAIGLHSTPRLLLGLHYWRRHMAAYGASSLLTTLYFFYFCDIFGLIGLTYVQSNEYFTFHAVAFSLFLICSNGFMVATLTINRSSGGTSKLKRLFLLHISSLVLTMYCYWRHNTYCEDYTYTFFSLFEYIIVFTNIGFHYHFGRAFAGSIVSIQSQQSGYMPLLPS